MPSRSGQRPLRVFRHGNLSKCSSGGLSGEIEQAIADSTWFMLLASPRSAWSYWVGLEIELWLATKSIDRFIIVLTGGDYLWDPTMSDFDLAKSSAIHPMLSGAFRQEPLVFDLRGAIAETNSYIRDRMVTGLVADIAKAVRGSIRP